MSDRKVTRCCLLGLGLFALVVIPGMAQNQTDGPTLKAAASRFFEVGTSCPVEKDHLLSPEETSLLLKNFSNITVAVHSERTQPSEESFHFEDCDNLVNNSLKMGLKIHGHALINHAHLADWFFDDHGKPASREVLLKRMRDHIQTLVSHFKGRVSSWDVVNEGLGTQKGEYLRPNKWKTLIGDDYIIEAFKAAHEADPSAELIYNDYLLEDPDKRAMALRLIKELRDHGCRIDAIGMQGHYVLDKINFKEVEAAITDFQNAGVKVVFSEMDMDVLPRRTIDADIATKENLTDKDRGSIICPPELLKKEAEQYGQLFQIIAKHADCVQRVTFWGLHDGRSWLNGRFGPRIDHPLLWDRNLAPKPAFYAVVNALSDSPTPSVHPAKDATTVSSNGTD